MPHETSLIATIAVGLALAFPFGLLAHRLRLTPIVGYLLAGLAVGPFTPGFVADAEISAQLAEIGVILLMFGVGIHFSLNDLLAVRNIAVPGALGKILLATLLGVGLATLWGWSLGAGIVFGLALSVASTVVLLKALEDRNAVESSDGRIAVGWLIRRSGDGACPGSTPSARRTTRRHPARWLGRHRLAVDRGVDARQGRPVCGLDARGRCTRDPLVAGSR